MSKFDANNSSLDNWGVMYDSYSDFLRIFDKSFSYSNSVSVKKILVGSCKILTTADNQPILIEVEEPHVKFNMDFEEMSKVQIIKFISSTIINQKDAHG